MISKILFGSIMILMMFMMSYSVQISMPATTCGTNNNPEKYEDCKDYGDNENHCCFVQSPGYNATIRQCAKILKTKYHGQRQLGIKANPLMISLSPEMGGSTLPIPLGSNYFRLDCGEIDFSKEKGELCGNDYVPNPADCWTFSTESKSCCSTEEQTEDKTYKCFWYKKKQGNVTNDDNMNLICSSTYAKKTILSLIIVFTIIFY